MGVVKNVEQNTDVKERQITRKEICVHMTSKCYMYMRIRDDKSLVS